MDAASVEVCGLPGGLIANPPGLDRVRRIVVAFDSGNGVVVGVHADTLEVLWTRDLDHAAHPLMLPATGEVVLGDFSREVGVEEVVVLDVTTGEERGRVSTQSLVQSVVFPAFGDGGEVYWTSFMTLSRIAVAPPA